MRVERGDPDLLVDERRERGGEEAGDVARAPQARWAACARGVQAAAELEGRGEAGRRLEGDLGALRQGDGGEARERREKPSGAR